MGDVASEAALGPAAQPTFACDIPANDALGQNRDKPGLFVAKVAVFGTPWRPVDAEGAQLALDPGLPVVRRRGRERLFVASRGASLLVPGQRRARLPGASSEPRGEPPT